MDASQGGLKFCLARRVGIYSFKASWRTLTFFLIWVKTVKEMAEGDEDLPRDAKIVKSLLKSMGVEDYEPRVIHQFLELWYRYVVDVLTDAQVYSEHAGKAAIDSDDVKLAIQSKVNFSFSQPPPREVTVVYNFPYYAQLSVFLVSTQFLNSIRSEIKFDFALRY